MEIESCEYSLPKLTIEKTNNFLIENYLDPLLDNSKAYYPYNLNNQINDNMNIEFNTFNQYNNSNYKINPLPTSNSGIFYPNNIKSTNQNENNYSNSINKSNILNSKASNKDDKCNNQSYSFKNRINFDNTNATQFYNHRALYDENSCDKLNESHINTKCKNQSDNIKNNNRDQNKYNNAYNELKEDQKEIPKEHENANINQSKINPLKKNNVIKEQSNNNETNFEDIESYICIKNLLRRYGNPEAENMDSINELINIYQDFKKKSK